MNIDFSFVSKHFVEKTNEQMKDVLMNTSSVSPSVHYYMIRGGFDQKNITVWEPGTIGGEYIKSYGHYHVGDLHETYWILFGQGVVLLQKLAMDENGEIIPGIVAEFKAVVVKPGDKVEIPVGFGHVIVNTGETFLVTADNTDVIFDEKTLPRYSGHADYELVKKMHGFAYYVIDNNDVTKLKKNINYEKVLTTDFGGFDVVE